MHDYFKNIGKALKAREQSPHKEHKVGALLVGEGYEVAQSNFFPEALERTIGHEQKLGNASTTVHAEIAAILSAPGKTENAALYVTQRPCPNCAKAIIEAGITELYISAETQDTALGLKIQPYFVTASLPFFTHAGIAVFEVGKECVPLNEPKACKLPYDHPDEPGDDDSKKPFATCIAHDKDGKEYQLYATPKTPQCLPDDKAEIIAADQHKYETALQPINRLLMQCARHGLTIDPETLYSSQTPTSREFVNMIGAGHTKLSIGNSALCRDEFGLQALEQLKKHAILLS